MATEVQEIRNPPRHRPPGAYLVDDYYRPEVRELRERYALEEKIDGAADRLEGALRLSNWLGGINTNGTPPREVALNALEILNGILNRGWHFHCSWMSVLMTQVAHAVGYGARHVALGWDGAQIKGSAHHGCSEIWIDGLDKWVYIDALHRLHYEKNGVPLSMLEIHHAVYGGGVEGMFMVVGPEREQIAVPNDTSVATMEVYQQHERRDPPKPYPTPGLFHWMAIQLNNARFAHLHQDMESWVRTMFVRTPYNAGKVWFQRLHADDSARNYHWVYWAVDSMEVWSPYQVDFPLNQVHIDWQEQDGHTLALAFETTCPNFSHFRIEIDGAREENVKEPQTRWTLPAGESTLTVQAVNLFGVHGTASRLRAVRRPE